MKLIFDQNYYCRLRIPCLTDEIKEHTHPTTCFEIVIYTTSILSNTVIDHQQYKKHRSIYNILTFESVKTADRRVIKGKKGASTNVDHFTILPTCKVVPTGTCFGSMNSLIVWGDTLTHFFVLFKTCLLSQCVCMCLWLTTPLSINIYF